jgi:hypothetical protein
VIYITAKLTEGNKQRPLCAVAHVIAKACFCAPCEVSVTVLTVPLSALCVSGYQMKLIFNKLKFKEQHTSAFSHALNITCNVFTAMTPSSSIA